MSDLIVVPLKKSMEIDIGRHLINILSSHCVSTPKPEDYTQPLKELSNQRNDAVWRVFDKNEFALDIIYRYYDQLCALESKVPAICVRNPFQWEDAFDKGSIFGGKLKSLTVSSLGFEKACILFNIAALQSSVAAAQSLDSDESLKLAAKLFQQSAGIFHHLKDTVMLAVQQEPTPDLNPDTLEALSALMLAQGQGVFVQKAIHDQMKDSVVAKLCAQCSELYVEVLKLFQKELLRPLWEKEWIPTIAGKQAAYNALAEYHQSLVCKDNKRIGEEIARLDHSLELVKAAQQQAGKPTYCQDLQNKIQHNLVEAKKDNDFIYHERIPDISGLSPIGKAQLVKSLPMSGQMSKNFKNLFEGLEPVRVLAIDDEDFNVQNNKTESPENVKPYDATKLLSDVLAATLPGAVDYLKGYIFNTGPQQGASGSSLPKPET